MLMRAEVIVPGAKQIQVLLGLLGQPHGPLAGQLLEGLEESLDVAVLPGREGRSALMPDAEQAESEPEERGGEDGLIVGPDAPWLAEAFNRVQDDAEDCDRGFGPHVFQCQACSGCVVEEPEYGAFTAAVADVGEIESPHDVRRHGLRLSVLDLAADGGDFVLSLPEHARATAGQR